MATVNIKDLNKAYGALEVLHGIELEIASGEFVVFVGPSGCGKSTLLRTIAGLEEVSKGAIYIGDTRVDGLSPAEREIAMVFQSYALYPHMTVRENMAFGLRMAKLPKDQIARRVAEAAEMLRVDQYLDRLPKELSGGQRQRVAIGRAITRDPKVFLFDEPLSNLDAALRAGTRIEIAKLKERLPDTTMIYVTHDQVEAMTLADRIVVLNSGRIEQVGTPLELYEKPVNKFVAGFVGSPAMNFLPAQADRDGKGWFVQTRTGGRVALSGQGPGTDIVGQVTIGVRPEHLGIDEQGTALAKGVVELVENLGDLSIIYVDIGETDPVVVKMPPSRLSEQYAEVTLHAPQDRIYLFGSDGASLTFRAQAQATVS